LPSRSFAADVDNGAPLAIRFGFPEPLIGYGSGIPLPEQDVAEQVHEGVALCPTEVAMRLFAGPRSRWSSKAAMVLGTIVLSARNTS
jgi:hypothetical protein